MPLSRLMHDVLDFNEKFGITPVEHHEPNFMEDDLAVFRINFLQEELNEIADAHGYVLNEEGNWQRAHPSIDNTLRDVNHLEHVLDGHIDLLYVLIGNLRLLGFHGGRACEAWKRVHAKNMAKERALKASQSKRGSIYDIIKPEGWTPPDLKDLCE